MFPTWLWLLLVGTPVLAIGLFIAGSFGWHPGAYIGVGLLVAWGLFVWWLARNTSFH